jgi:hypothetical protein
MRFCTKATQINIKFGAEDGAQGVQVSASVVVTSNPLRQ